MYKTENIFEVGGCLVSHINNSACSSYTRSYLYEVKLFFALNTSHASDFLFCATSSCQVVTPALATSWLSRAELTGDVFQSWPKSVLEILGERNYVWDSQNAPFTCRNIMYQVGNG